jgi:hypothetical protein
MSLGFGADTLSICLALYFILSTFNYSRTTCNEHSMAKRAPACKIGEKIGYGVTFGF